MGQTRRFNDVRVISTYPPKSGGTSRHFALVPLAELQWEVRISEANPSRMSPFIVVPTSLVESGS
jgi:hypothetical protein